jgi:hypothetical protein
VAALSPVPEAEPAPEVLRKAPRRREPAAALPLFEGIE